MKTWTVYCTVCLFHVTSPTANLDGTIHNLLTDHPVRTKTRWALEPRRPDSAAREPRRSLINDSAARDGVF